MISRQVTKGKHMVKYLNMMDIAVACIGNHDFDFGVDNLERLMALSNFPWLLSNVVTKSDGAQLAHAERSIVRMVRARVAAPAALLLLPPRLLLICPACPLPRGLRAARCVHE